jgi:hypothetical protein
MRFDSRFMKYTVAIFLLFSNGAAFGQGTTTDKPTADEYADAQAVGKEINEALVKASATGLSNMKLQKADVKLETGSELSGDIELNFIIFTIQHKRSKGITQTTELVFQTPQNAGANNLPPRSLSEPLARAIAIAAETAKQITVLPVGEATITIEFAVSKDTSGKLSFKVLGATLGGGIDLNKTSKNSLTVTFK